MTTLGRLTSSDTIRFERRLPGPVQRVWEYLTDPVKRGTWLASGPMELRAGGAARLHFRHRDVTHHQEPTPERFKAYENGVVHDHEVIRCEAPKLLVLSWGHGPCSEVTFELTPDGDDVLLTLTHRRLTSRDEMRLVAGGWDTHLSILEDELNRRERRAFWSNFERAELEYDRLIPRG